jgi:serine/threonine protein phosphatase PrpC
MITAEPDVTRTPLVDSDEFVVLACDGIWDCKTNQVGRQAPGWMDGCTRALA